MYNSEFKPQKIEVTRHNAYSEPYQARKNKFLGESRYNEVCFLRYTRNLNHIKYRKNTLALSTKCHSCHAIAQKGRIISATVLGNINGIDIILSFKYTLIFYKIHIFNKSIKFINNK